MTVEVDVAYTAPPYAILPLPVATADVHEGAVVGHEPARGHGDRPALHVGRGADQVAALEDDVAGGQRGLLHQPSMVFVRQGVRTTMRVRALTALLERMKCLLPPQAGRMVTGRDKPDASRVSDDVNVYVCGRRSTAPAVVNDTRPSQDPPAMTEARRGQFAE